MKAWMSSNFGQIPTPTPELSALVRLNNVCVSVCVSVDIFKLEYLCNQWANRNKILTEPLLGWGKAALGFGPDRIGTLVSMATDSSHRVIMGKIL